MTENGKNNSNYDRLNLKNMLNVRYVDNDDELVAKYINDARKFNVITQDEEQDLITRIKHDDPDSERLTNKLIGSHQPFVITLARKNCIHNTKLFLDLVQEGNYGMLIALNKFDVDSDIKFMSYANAWILKYMYLFLHNNDLIKRYNREKLCGVDVKVRDQFTKDYGYEPTTTELFLILNEMGVGIKHESDLNELQMVSLDQPIGMDNDDDDDTPATREIPTYDDVVNNIDTEINKQTLYRLLDKLSDTEKLVVMKMFGIGTNFEMNAETIGKALGMSGYTVDKIYRTAIAKLARYKNLFK